MESTSTYISRSAKQGALVTAQPRPHHRVVALAVAVFSLLLILSHTPNSAFALPSSAEIDSLRTEAATARERLDTLAVELEVATEDYHEARDALAAANTRVKAARDDLDRAESDLIVARQRMNDRAASIYRAGDFALVDVLLGAESFRSLVSSLDFMRRVSETDARLVAEVRELRSQLVRAEERLTTERAQARELASEAKDHYQKIHTTLDEQERYLDSVDEKLDAAIQKERDRLEAEARARAQAAAAARQKQSITPVSGGRASDAGSLGAPRSEVVAIARQFLGVTPYVWGGSTPSGFDCSGLTMYCYRQIGINIPRTSRQQYTIGKHIPPDRKDLLQPGDLLFFARSGSPSGIHHVAIYSGNGMMIHAPQSGMRVSETSLAARSDYVGASRP